MLEYKVLIVEDEILVSAGLKNMIHWSEMDMEIVGEARNGQQGLELYRQKQPDIILTDIKMPVMDGLEMIRRIREKDPDTRIIVLSCYEEFDLVRQAFRLGISDYIAKLQMLPDEMEQVIRKVWEDLVQEGKKKMEKETLPEPKATVKDEMQEKAADWIMEGSDSGEVLFDLLRAFQLPDRGTAVCVMNLIPAKEEAGKKTLDDNARQVVREVTEELLAENRVGELLREQEGSYLILLNSERNVEEILYRIHNSMQNYVNHRAVFGIGGTVPDLPASYREAMAALREAIFFERWIVEAGKTDTMQEYERILRAAEQRSGMTREISEEHQEQMQMVISKIRSMKNITRERMQDTLIREIHLASFEYEFGKKEQTAQSALKAVEALKRQVSLRQMLCVIDEYFSELYPPETNRRMTGREVRALVSYVKAHYEDSELSLSRAAEAVELNKDYLSSLFKKEMGIGFSDYVNMLRIRKAKELLLETHMKNYEIADRVGFQDESYFSRIFKKSTGMRPSEYKRRGLTADE